MGLLVADGQSPVRRRLGMRRLGVLGALRMHGGGAKGTEYAEATHPEAATNRALGIRMEFVGDKKAPCGHRPRGPRRAAA